MTKTEQDTGTEVLVFTPDNPVAIFQSPEQFDELLGKIKATVAAHKPDLTTAKGRGEIKSLAAKVTRTKTTLDAAGKKLNEDARAKINVVDAERRRIWSELETLADIARKPLTDWEAAEAMRESEVRGKMELVQNAANMPAEATSVDINTRIAELDEMTFDADVFQDYLEIAIAAKTTARETLVASLARTMQAEQDAAELAELRRKQAERDEADRLAADAKVKADLEAETSRIAEEKRKQDLIDEQARQAKAETKRLADIKAAEDAAAETARVEAGRVAQAKIDAANAETKRLQDAENARIAEQDRIAAEQAARDKDTAHKTAVMKAAKDAVISEGGVTEDQARKIVLAIKAGLVPNVSLVF